MKILHISDTHIGGSKHYNPEVLQEVVKEAKTGDYDFIIHSGDITQDGRETQYKKAEEIFSTIEKPLIAVPGNHDARSGGIHLFKKHIRECNGYQEIDDAIIVYVNSTLPDSGQGRVGSVKFNMLRKALNDYSHKAIKIVVLHHHIVPVPMAGRERNVLYNAGDMLDLITKADVDLVLSGHRHYPNIYRIENTVFINAGTTSGKKTRYGDINSYNIIEIEGKNQKITTKRIDGSRKVNRYRLRQRRIYSRLGKRLFRVVHLSNTFFSETHAFLEQHFLNAAETIHSLKPDLIVHCGGIVREGVTQDYYKAFEYLPLLKYPIVYSPAGRDINYLGYYLFTTYLGAFDQTFTNGEILFQGVSSPQYDSPIGMVGPTERNELIEKINNSQEKIKAVFLHHNVLPIPHSREKGLLEDSGDLLKELVGADVDLVLTGTSSHPHVSRVENTLVVNANSTSSIYQRSMYGNSFNVIDIYENAITVSEINSLWAKKKLLGIWETANARR